MTNADRACRAALAALGAEFAEQPPRIDPLGCRIDHPLVVKRLTSAIDIKPAAEVNCTVALELARFAAEAASPAADEIAGKPLAGIDQASGYVCRPRNGTSKLSEHAFGNAIDIAAFRLAGGRKIAVGSEASPFERAFVGEVRRAACGPFKTVLGPGSDSDHATHLHLDLAPRRSGSTFCQ